MISSYEKVVIMRIDFHTKVFYSYSNLIRVNSDYKIYSTLVEHQLSSLILFSLTYKSYRNKLFRMLFCSVGTFFKIELF